MGEIKFLLCQVEINFADLSSFIGPLCRLLPYDVMNIPCGYRVRKTGTASPQAIVRVIPSDRPLYFDDLRGQPSFPIASTALLAVCVSKSRNCFCQFQVGVFA